MTRACGYGTRPPARAALSLSAAAQVNALAVSPDGALVAGATTITVQTWEPAAGEPGHTVSGGHDHLTAVAFASSGALLGIASTDKTAMMNTNLNQWLT